MTADERERIEELRDQHQQWSREPGDGHNWRPGAGARNKALANRRKRRRAKQKQRWRGRP